MISVRHFLHSAAIVAAAMLISCNNATTVSFVETDELFPNPERGFHSQIYYGSRDLSAVADPEQFMQNREGEWNLTLYLHTYYLTDYMTSDIAPEFFERMEKNMRALRDGGAKCIIRFAYKANYRDDDHPWDASQEWVSRHIDQIEPYLKKNADVIFCMEAGFIGSWGEWYYTDGFPFDPQTLEAFKPRLEFAEHLMRALPEDRQICFRTPGYKILLLKSYGMDTVALTEEEAFQPTVKARWAGHNDCFVSSAEDVGTYFSDYEREFWAADTKYTIMGGETCRQCEYSNGEHAVSEMERYHWTHLNMEYQKKILNEWVEDGHMDEVKRRLGYRLVLDNAIVRTRNHQLSATVNLHNVGFAAPMNARLVEMVLVKGEEKHVFVQDIDPRHWFAGEAVCFEMKADVSELEGEYELYLNLPDPYASLHDDPRFSIRCANQNTWCEETGYNHLATIKL